MNWVDWESFDFLTTLPASQAAIAPDPTPILDLYKQVLDCYNVITGRPMQRFRGEYLTVDIQSWVLGTIPAGYPMSIPNDDVLAQNFDGVPVNILDTILYMQDWMANTVLHEMGHLHNMPTLLDETETNVDVPAMMVYNVVLNKPMDTAQTWHLNKQGLDGDEVSWDWMLSPTFRNGQRLSWEECAYQSRGSGKYGDIARIFSWDTLGLINGHF